MYNMLTNTHGVCCKSRRVAAAASSRRRPVPAAADSGETFDTRQTIDVPGRTVIGYI